LTAPCIDGFRRGSKGTKDAAATCTYLGMCSTFQGAACPASCGFVLWHAIGAASSSVPGRQPTLPLVLCTAAAASCRSTSTARWLPPRPAPFWVMHGMGRAQRAMSVVSACHRVTTACKSCHAFGHRSPAVLVDLIVSPCCGTLRSPGTS